MRDEWLNGKMVLAVLAVLMGMLFTGAVYASENLDFPLRESPMGPMDDKMHCPGDKGGTEMHDDSVACHGMSNCDSRHSDCKEVTTIPEFPTVAIPAILALGGYLLIRTRRRKE